MPRCPVLSNLIRQSGSAGELLINVTFGPRAVGDINAFNDFLGVAGPYLVSLRLQSNPLLLEGDDLGKHQDANLHFFFRDALFNNTYWRFRGSIRPSTYFYTAMPHILLQQCYFRSTGGQNCALQPMVSADLLQHVRSYVI